MTPQVKSLHREASRLTDEMVKLEMSGSDEIRLGQIYDRLIEIEKELWG